MKNCHKQIIFIALVTLNLYQISEATVSTGNFNEDFFITWSPSYVNTSFDGRTRSLKLDKDSGSGFASKEKFLFGQIDMKIKLVPGRSAGTVVAFYMKSDNSNSDEMDFEFLGNVIGKPYNLQTNVFVNGFGDREERIHLWFDATKEFHTYSILWNIHLILFMVDGIPIRVHRNNADKGIAFPQWQPMTIQITLWNGESWAIGGGRKKIDWSKAPFIASFRDYKIDAGVWTGNLGSCRATNNSNWWNNKWFSRLTPMHRRLLNWVRKEHMYYDYCQDKRRFGNKLPKECSLPN
ncbi:probable xyloglucan endotransglucosylase/hydrolase protein 10 [Fagus crenata]